MNAEVRKMLVALSVVLGLDRAIKLVVESPIDSPAHSSLVGAWFVVMVLAIVVVATLVGRRVAPGMVSGLMSGGLVSMLIDRVVVGDPRAFVVVGDLAHIAVIVAISVAAVGRALTPPHRRRISTSGSPTFGAG